MNARTEEAAPLADENGVAIRPFTAVAAMMPTNPLDELAIETARVTRAILESELNKPSGKITLVIDFGRAQNVADALILTSEIKVKMPKRPKAAGLLFADADGNLTDRNPNQRELFTGPRG